MKTRAQAMGQLYELQKTNKQQDIDKLLLQIW
jgi:hypothetical protein